MHYHVIRNPCVRFFYALIFFLLSSSLAADWMPFSIENGSIILVIEIAGRPARAFLDTVASANAISVDFVSQYEKGVQRSPEEGQW